MLMIEKCSGEHSMKCSTRDDLRAIQKAAKKLKISKTSPDR